MQSILALEDGRIFRGLGYGHPGECQGEVVFNTSLTGYQEIATDPSYAGQIVVLTNPEIGNYGTRQADNESARPYIEGLIVREFSPIGSNWRSEQVTDEYMERYSVPVLAEIDTRALVRHLRTHGRQVARQPLVQLFDLVPQRARFGAKRDAPLEFQDDDAFVFPLLDVESHRLRLYYGYHFRGGGGKCVGARPSSGEALHS